MSRSGWEFSQAVKDKAISEWHWENPGREDEKLEVDHLVAIWWMKENGVPPVVGRSQQNAGAKTREDHYDKHRNESNEGYAEAATGLLGFVGGLFNN